MSTTAAKIANLTPAQMKLLAARLAAKSAASRPAEPASRIPRQPRDGRDHVLSLAQERLWLACQMAPDSTAYSIPLAVHLKLSPEHNFDPGPIAAAMDALAARHEGLRTVFIVTDGVPMQRVLPGMHIPMEVHDLRHVPHGGRAMQALDVLGREIATPFDLANGPLLRLTVAQLDTAEWMLLINSHHLVSDSWSLGVLLREMITVATAARLGGQANLPRLAIQPLDHAAWERGELAGGRAARALAWWDATLAGELPILRLPFRAPAGPPAASGETIRCVLPPDLAAQVDALARAQATTPFGVMLAGYKLLLQRVCRLDDVIVGTPVANRTMGEIEGLIGCFINTVVLRTDLAQPGSFRQIVARVAATVEGAMAHGDCPFELLVARKRPDRDHPPLFQTLFTMQNAPIDSTMPAGSMAMLDLDTGAAKFDLSLTAQAIDGGYRLSWNFRADRAGRADIETLAGCYTGLLGRLLADPEADTGAFPLASPAEPPVVAARPSDAPVLFDRRFDAAARRAPGRQAVMSTGGALTYATLRRRANAMAAALVAVGVGPGDVVPLGLGRGPGFITAMLAILKAGAAYLPLDLAWPGERIAGICRIAGARHAIVAADLAAQLPSGCANLLPGIDALAEADDAPSGLARSPDDLAYVIFTSGSTGTPKGVMVAHRQLAFYVDAVSALMDLPDGARYAALATQAADLGHTMTFPALAAGGTLLLTDEAALLDPELLAVGWAASPPDAVKIVPSHLASLLGVARPERVLPTRLLVLGGEACPAALVARVHEIAPGLRILNHYGPTETTVGVIAGEIDPAEAAAGAWQTAPLGRAFPGVRASLRDACGHPVPDGLPGELYIGGQSVSRGYLNAPELTAQRFLPAGAAGGPVYRTGDLGCRLPSGAIAFLGRTDDQVKIRGLRVEPAEIEAAIGLWPAALANVVRPVAMPGGLALAAWVAVGPVPADAHADLRAGLLAHLRASLPAGLVPGAITLLAELPRTANGKPDRAALRLETAAATVVAAPRSSLELEMAQLWEDALQRAPIGIDADFFELGGDSLLAVRLVTLIRARFAVALPLAAFFEHRTVARLARLLQETADAGAEPGQPDPVVVIRRSGTRPPVFFVHPAGGNVLCYYDLAQALHPEQPFYALQAAAPDAAGALSIAAMAELYVAALRRIRPAGPYHLGGWSMGGVIAFEMAMQLRAAGQDVASLVIVDTPAPGRVARDLAGQVDGVTALAIYVRKLELFGGARFGLDADTLRSLSPAQRMDALLGAMRTHRMVPDDVTAAQLEALVTLQQHHNAAIVDYIPGRFDGPVTLIRSTGPLAVQEEADLYGLAAIHAEDDLGWRRHAPSLSVARVPGNHVSMMTQPHVVHLAASLDDALAGPTGARSSRQEEAFVS